MRRVNPTGRKNSRKPSAKSSEQSFQRLQKRSKKISILLQETHPHLPAPGDGSFAWRIKRDHHGFVHKWWGFLVRALRVHGACSVRKCAKYLEFMGSDVRRKWKSRIRRIIIRNLIYANPFNRDVKNKYRATDRWQGFHFLRKGCWSWRCNWYPWLWGFVWVTVRRDTGFALHNSQLTPNRNKIKELSALHWHKCNSLLRYMGGSFRRRSTGKYSIGPNRWDEQVGEW